MTAPDLPAELKAALDAKLHGFSRSDAASRAAAISQTYREGGGSAAIRSETDALAYALARMPATYAAVIASLNALREVAPDFAPESLIDVGAGPGTAVWAAAEAFPSLQDFGLLDANGAFRALALDLASGSARLRDIRYRHREARAALADADPADLVMASYMIGEIGESRTTCAFRSDVGENPRHARRRRARHARGLWQDHQLARATDCCGRACRGPLPA